MAYRILIGHALIVTFRLFFVATVIKRFWGDGMNLIVGIGFLVFVGWIIVQILPVLLPYIGYAIVGLLALMAFGALTGKK